MPSGIIKAGSAAPPGRGFIFAVCLFLFAGGLAGPSFAADSGVKIKVAAVITAAGESAGRFNQPSGIFYDVRKKRLYIADSANKRIVSLDSEFRYVGEFSKNEILLPADVVKNSSGLFFIVDAGRGEVLLIDVAKDRVEPVAFKGVPEGSDPFVPGRLAIDGQDRLYVIDRLNKRIVVADTEGAFLRSVTVKDDPSFHGFNDVRVDEAGNIYALDTVGGKVYVFDGNGRPVSNFGGRDESKGGFRFPASLAVARNGNVYVADRHAGRIMVFNRGGALQYTISRKGAKEGELLSPSYIFIDGEQRIFIIDGNRIQIFKEERE